MRYPDVLRWYCSECMKSRDFVFDAPTKTYVCSGDLRKHVEGCGRKIRIRDGVKEENRWR